MDMNNYINILKENKVEGVQNENLIANIGDKRYSFHPPSDETKIDANSFNKNQSPSFIRSSKIKFT